MALNSVCKRTASSRLHALLKNSGASSVSFRSYSLRRSTHAALGPQVANLNRAHSFITKRWATSVTLPLSATDPAESEALRCLEQGTAKLEEGDVNGAKALYQRSTEIKRTASSLFNLGVTHYHLKEYDDAIASWKESIALQPSSPDAHTNLASAYIISPMSRPDLALHHLEIACSLSPEDPEIAFNHAAVLEATGKLEEALEEYKRSQKFGVERAAVHIRNVGAKILGQKMKEMQKDGKSED